MAKKFICAECNEVINHINEGWFEWCLDNNQNAFGFRIVHHKSFSPRKKVDNYGCYYTTHIARDKVRDLHLKDLCGAEGIEHLRILLNDLRTKDFKSLLRVAVQLHGQKALLAVLA